MSPADLHRGLVCFLQFLMLLMNSDIQSNVISSSHSISAILQQFLVHSFVSDITIIMLFVMIMLFILMLFMIMLFDHKALPLHFPQNQNFTIWNNFIISVLLLLIKDSVQLLCMCSGKVISFYDYKTHFIYFFHGFPIYDEL